MTQEPEFNLLHIFLGSLVAIQLLRFINITLYHLFNDLSLILVFIIILIKVYCIMYTEMKIWAMCD